MKDVRLAMERSQQHDNHDFDLWKQALSDDNFELSLSNYGRIDVSYDMAWQQRSSGHKYNSPSGHALLVGQLS